MLTLTNKEERDKILKKARALKEKQILFDINQRKADLIFIQIDEDFKNALTELEEKKIELEEINAYQAQGAWIRARAKYYIEGERPTKLFCSLEKHNGVQKYIPKLKVEKDGVEEDIVEQILIEEEIYYYYKKLFSAKPTEINDIDDFLTEFLIWTV